nr:TPA_asm: ATP synthase F0 subunit 8 [Microgale fotsifotsy]
MPQLDTTPWFITIMSMLLTLYFIMQSKISKITMHLDPSTKPFKSTEHHNPWNNKWTKIYLPHSLPQH